MVWTEYSSLKYLDPVGVGLIDDPYHYEAFLLAEAPAVSHERIVAGEASLQHNCTLLGILKPLQRP